MTFKQKVRNIWDYDKWFIIGGIIVAVLLVIFIRDVFFKEKYDVSIVSVSYGYMSLQEVEAAEKFFSSLASDVNNDKKVTANLLNIEFSPENQVSPQLDRDATTKLMAELTIQENCLFIIDKENFQSIWKNDYSSLTDLSIYSEDLEKNTYFIPIKETALKEQLPFLDGELLLILRVPYDTRYTEVYNNHLDVVKRLLNY